MTPLRGILMGILVIRYNFGPTVGATLAHPTEAPLKLGITKIVTDCNNTLYLKRFYHISSFYDHK